ncbi:MAG: hypothetical protein JWR01_670, partial [Subtercola sp.]|nr:hypothetical protein [Subtercola sp.]
MDAALDSGVRRSPRRDFRLAPAGRFRRLAAVLAVVTLALLWMLGGTGPADAATTPTPSAPSPSAPTPSAPASTPPTSTAPAGDANTGPAATGSTPLTGSVVVSLAPDNAGVQARGADLAVSVSIANTTGSALPPGSIHLWLDRSGLDTRDALNDWLAPSTAATEARDSLATDVATPGLPAGGTGTFRAALPAAELGLST